MVLDFSFDLVPMDLEPCWEVFNGIGDTHDYFQRRRAHDSGRAHPAWLLLLVNGHRECAQAGFGDMTRDRLK